MMEMYTKILDNFEQIDVIYLDLCKVFDTVPHERLMCKLAYMESKIEVLEWIHDLQCVVINGTSSKWRTVKSRVTQGCLFGSKGNAGQQIKQVTSWSHTCIIYISTEK